MSAKQLVRIVLTDIFCSPAQGKTAVVAFVRGDVVPDSVEGGHGFFVGTISASAAEGPVEKTVANVLFVYSQEARRNVSIPVDALSAPRTHAHCWIVQDADQPVDDTLTLIRVGDAKSVRKAELTDIWDDPSDRPMDLNAVTFLDRDGELWEEREWLHENGGTD